MPVRTESEIKLIFKHTPSDYKLKTDNGLMVLYPAPYSCLGLIENMPEDAFNAALMKAKHREVQEVAVSKLKPIMEKHGLIEHFCSTHPWRDSLYSVLKFASFALKSEQAVSDLEADILSANIKFNGC